MLSFARRLLGRPLPRAEADSQRLPSLIALPILSSDALSSVAYATEAALGVLLLAGSAALGWSLPITVCIVGLIAIVVLSYRQAIEAYPEGGGSYVVARENLGPLGGAGGGGGIAGGLHPHRGGEPDGGGSGLELAAAKPAAA